MGHQNDPTADSRLSESYENGAAPHEELELARVNAVRAKAADETAAAIARELNGPLTALLLYMGEIKHHSNQLSPASGDRAYLQRVVENALAQTERVCTLVKQLAGPHKNGFAVPVASQEADAKAGPAAQAPRTVAGELAGPPGQKRLTRRERGAAADQRRLFQQAGRVADADQSADVREPSRRGDA